MGYRIESDTIGTVEVPDDKLWGAQTERSRHNFRIGPAASMPIELIRALAQIKKAAAVSNYKLGVLEQKKAQIIAQVCDEILQGQHNEQFPLVIWQTGSGTQTNMNLNEVIANRGHILNGGNLNESTRYLHPNDDVNKSQSSNDTFPTAMHIAAYELTCSTTLEGIEALKETLRSKSADFDRVVKTGRTHFMDATPLTLGQEFSAFVQQLENGIRAIRSALAMIAELAIGGTAVGTGMNTPVGYDRAMVSELATQTGFPFVIAPNKFEALAANDAMVELSGAFRRVAVSLMKIANDIRMLSSGPRCAIGEILIPRNEPGSSVMPGKVNPTQAEAITMVAAQVIGNDVTTGVAGSNGHFQLNVFKPVIARNVLESARLLGDACLSFSENCVAGIQPNTEVIEKHLQDSLMLVTSLNTRIGYKKSAEIANKAYREGTTLRQAALELGYLTPEEFDLWVDPLKMIGNTPH